MTDEMRAAEIKKWQDGLFDAFRHNGVLGDRYFGPVLELEPLVGGVFVEKYFGHRVLTDSFMDFFGETLSKQGEFNSKNGWPQDRPYYVTCLMMYLTMFRSLRAAEVAALNGYPLQGYIVQRSLKDQAFILCGAANNLATFGELFGWDGIEGEGKWTEEQQAQIVKNRMKIEDKLSRKILGEKSGFSLEVRKELESWSRLFNTEAHRGLFTLFRASHLLLDRQRMVVGPANDEMSESMYMNRCTEVCWMMHRLLPFMRRAETPKDAEWDRKWKLLDDSFKMMVDGLAGLGKKIAPAMVELVNTKFAFAPDFYYFEPTKAQA